MGIYDNETIEEVQCNKYLAFLIDGQSYGIDIKDVVEIISMQPISKVPEFAEYAKGIINLRGKVIPVVDVRARFYLAESDYDSRTCIIINNINGIEIGFIVDSVQEVIDLEEEQIEEAPKLSSGYSHRFVSGVGKWNGKMVLLLDSQKMLGEQELDILGQAL